eukprot:3244422-Rhodomonas_salina.2
MILPGAMTGTDLGYGATRGSGTGAGVEGGVERGAPRNQIQKAILLVQIVLGGCQNAFNLGRDHQPPARLSPLPQADPTLRLTLCTHADAGAGEKLPGAPEGAHLPVPDPLFEPPTPTASALRVPVFGGSDGPNADDAAGAEGAQADPESPRHGHGRGGAACGAAVVPGVSGGGGPAAFGGRRQGEAQLWQAGCPGEHREDDEEDEDAVVVDKVVVQVVVEEERRREGCCCWRR